MKFSICIPNYNYGGYIGETIESVLNQEYTNFEVIIVDNNSSDNSWEVIQSYVKKDERVKAYKNAINLGFAGNLERVSELAEGDYHILLSSDDIMNKGTLENYNRFLEKIGGEDNVITASCGRIDENNNSDFVYGPRENIWFEKDIDETLSKEMGYNVYKVKSSEILKRSLLTYISPLHFASTCYSKKSYQAVGGYGGGKLTNPDKWFHLKVLSVTEYAYNIDFPFFSYRVHNNNQVAQIKKSGSLKLFIDEYRTTFETSKEMLEKAGVSEQELHESYIVNIIHKHIFRKLKEGQSMEGFRIFCLGVAGFPGIMFKKRNSYTLFLLILLGKFGQFILKLRK